MTSLVTPLEASAQNDLVRLRVTDIRDEAEHVRSFELRDPGGAELPSFDAGAHLQVEVELAHGQIAQRRYSLFGDPQDRSRYQIAVFLEAGGRGGSRFMHERVVPGSILRVAAPENGFALVEAEHTVLIAGGIGITPILSMVHTLTRTGCSYELHYAARTPARMAFRGTIEALAGEHAHFYLTHVERPQTVDLEALLAAPRLGARVYVCGPPAMIQAATLLGQEAGWPTDRIHVESFGSTRRADDRLVEVYLERSGLTLQVPSGETILDAILEAGVWVSYECRRGVCASCMTRVVDGEPDHRDACLSPELREQYMCPCVSRARSTRLVLDL